MKKFAIWVNASIVATSFLSAGCSGEATTPSGENVALGSQAEAIIGGTNVSQSEFQKKYPWMVAVYSLDDPNPTQPNFTCGGVVIGERWILTGAHCIDAMRYLFQSRSVAVGVGNAVEAKTKKIGVDAVYFHPKWLELTSQYDPKVDPLPPSEKAQGDLALVHLTERAGVKGVGFIDEIEEEKCLAKPGSDGVFLGWGDTTPSYEYNPPDTLQRVSLQISARKDCLALDPNLDRTELCAIVGPDGRDTCFGDSGGPVLVKNHHNELVVAGLLSWGGENQGKDCGVPTAVNGFARMAVLGRWVEACRENSKRCGANAFPFPNADGSLTAPPPAVAAK